MPGGGYINFDFIFNLIKKNEDFRIIGDFDGKDLTIECLAQMLLTLTNGNQDKVSLSGLKTMISVFEKYEPPPQRARGPNKYKKSKKKWAIHYKSSKNHEANVKAEKKSIERNKSEAYNRWKEVNHEEENLLDESEVE